MGIDEHWHLNKTKLLKGDSVIMRNRSKLRYYIILTVSIVLGIFVLSKIFPNNNTLDNYYDDVTVEDTSKLALKSNTINSSNKVLHCVAAEMLIPTMQTHSHNNTKYCYV